MQHGVELAGQHHRADAFVGGNLMHDDAGRRLEAGGAAVTAIRRALHPEFHVFRRDAEFMLQHAARPQRRGLLIFRHADALALEIGRRLDAGFAATNMLVWKNRRVVKIGKPTKRVSPCAVTIKNDEQDISDTANSAKCSCRQNSSEGCSTVGIRSMPSTFTVPSRIGQVRGLEVMPMLSGRFMG